MSNLFPGIGYTNYGRDHNYFRNFSVTATTFGGTSVDGYQPDGIITFSTQGIIIINNSTGSNKILEGSFNGTTVHFELNPETPSRSLTFNNRVVSKFWLRVKSGSTGPILFSIHAW